MQTIRETWLIYRRSLILTLRQPVWLLMGIFQPILYLVLFGPLLQGAVTQAGAGANAFDWFVPGMLVMISVFGAAFVGFGLIAELRNGVVERMRVTPMSRMAMLLGRSLRDATLLLMQAIIMIVIAIPFGITIDPTGIAVTLALVGLIGLAMAPLSYSAALVLKSEDSFAPLVQFVALPLLLLSGVFLPLQLAPTWLQTLSELNPVTYAVDAVRAAFNGMWGDPAIVTGAAMTISIAALAVWVAARVFSRATA
jgi:ABC-2 type transport system permease protein